MESLMAFQQGDKVIRTGSGYGDVVEGQIYTVHSQHGLNVFLVESSISYSSESFDLVEVSSNNLDTLTITYKGITMNFIPSIPFSRKIVDSVLDVIYKDSAE